jgi:hypothetical protein
LSIWFLLWLLLSSGMLYFLGWTLFILYRQKNAWRAYAKRCKLRYTSSRMLGSPEMSGTLDNYAISFFTAEHTAPDARSVRKLTAIEIPLLTKLPAEGAVASGGMVAFVHRLGLPDEHKPAHTAWNKEYVVKTTNRYVMEEYLTPGRLDALTDLMKVKNAWIILVFKNDTSLLRFDSPDPLDSEKKIDYIVKKMLDAVKALELKPGEEGRLKLSISKKPVKEIALNVPEDKKVDGLQLEDDT